RRAEQNRHAARCEGDPRRTSLPDRGARGKRTVRRRGLVPCLFCGQDAHQTCVKCPGCSAEMTSMKVEAHLTAPLTIDVCTPCQAFWFDKYEDLKISAASTLKLIRLIGENSSTARIPPAEIIRFPRCASRLLLRQDLHPITHSVYP